jgi:hypothetical protein
MRAGENHATHFFQKSYFLVVQKLEKENMRAGENNATHFFQKSYFH